MQEQEGTQWQNEAPGCGKEGKETFPSFVFQLRVCLSLISIAMVTTVTESSLGRKGFIWLTVQW